MSPTSALTSDDSDLRAKALLLGILHNLAVLRPTSFTDAPGSQSQQDEGRQTETAPEQHAEVANEGVPQEN